MMKDALALLAVTADLHAAARDPNRWPSAWSSLCRRLACPDVFGNGAVAAADLNDLQDRIALTSSVARHCAHSGTGRCGRSAPEADEAKQRACLLLADHLDIALERSVSANAAVPPERYFAKALDALPVAVICCDVNGLVLHANPSAALELARAGRLGLRDGYLWAADPMLQRRVATAMQELNASAVDDESSPSVCIDASGAEICVHRLRDADAGTAVLLVTMTTAARVVERSGWPPR